MAGDQVNYDATNLVQKLKNKFLKQINKIVPAYLLDRNVYFPRFPVVQHTMFIDEGMIAYMTRNIVWDEVKKRFIGEV
jgi:hypothetical protein